MHTHSFRFGYEPDLDSGEHGATRTPCRGPVDRDAARSRLALLRRQLLAELVHPAFPHRADLLLEFLECAHVRSQD